MFINTNYHPNIHVIDKANSVQGTKHSNETNPVIENARMDKFEKSTPEDAILQDSNDFAYGSPEYASKAYLRQAAMASLCQKVDDSEVKPPETNSKHKRIEKTEKSDYTHNDEAYAREQSDGEKKSGYKK